MKLNRTAGYAIHALVHIARHEGNGHPAIGHMVAQETGIPEGFLLRLLVSMSRAGLLRSIKGPNGGYNLARPAKVITLLDVIEAVEGPVVATADPISRPPAALDKKLQAVAETATENVRKELGRVTLADLAGGLKKAR